MGEKQCFFPTCQARVQWAMSGPAPAPVGPRLDSNRADDTEPMTEPMPERLPEEECQTYYAK